METIFIRTVEEWEAWFAERKSYDIDFDRDCPQLPVMVVWVDTESNGHPYIYWDTFDAARLQRAIKNFN